MNEKRAELADRIRSLLSDEPTCEQKPMFGTLAFMLRGRLLVAAGREGDLLVRVDAERSAELLLLPGARQAEMGPKRTSMGPSWLTVEGEALDDDDQLLFWIDLAREHNAAGE